MAGHMDGHTTSQSNVMLAIHRSRGPSTSDFAKDTGVSNPHGDHGHVDFDTEEVTCMVHMAHMGTMGT